MPEPHHARSIASRLLCLLAVAVCVAVAACNRAGERDARAPRPRPNVLLLTIDTLRADRVGAYGYALDTTPTVDALAARGVRFSDVTVPWPKTWPAMAAMVTGKAPQSNGIRLRPRRPLPDDNVTLAEVLRDAGWATGAVVANVNLGRSFGFDQGFERFVESWADEALRLTGSATFRNRPGLVKRFTDGTRVTDQALSVLDELGGGKERPFFLWLHYIDPHGPYVPPPGYGTLFAGAHPANPVRLDDLPPYQLQIDPATGEPSNDLGFYQTQYDREVRYLDDQLGRLFTALEERGVLRDTLIVFTADHGESLDENRYYLEHGNVPYQSNAAIPLIFVLDGRLAAGRVVERPVGLLDLMPTVLALTGVPPPAEAQGTSLVPLLDGEDDGAPRYVFMESGKVEPSQLTVRRGPWKLVHLRAATDREWLGRKEVELYDLSRDPSERHDVRERHPEVAAELEAALASWWRDTPRHRGKRTTDLKQLDGRTQDMLRALGYLE
ncbi:MAG: sulfatase [Thermodesulfobacteriota bacterium]